MAPDRQNPFAAADVDHFPSLTQIFTRTPTIDTIARTRPAEFSPDQKTDAGGSAPASVGVAGCRARAEPNYGTGTLVGSTSEARGSVVKQLVFSFTESSQNTPNEDSIGTCVSDAWVDDALTKGQDAHLHGESNEDAGQTRAPSRGDESSSIPASSCRVSDMHGGSADLSSLQRSSTTRSVAVQTEFTLFGRSGHEHSFARKADWPTKNRQGGLDRTPEPRTHVFFKPAQLGQVRSPSMPTLLSSRDRHSNHAAPTKTNFDEARLSLDQRPCYPFTEYLHGLQSRWGHPLDRQRFNAMGISPPRRWKTYYLRRSLTPHVEPDWHKLSPQPPKYLSPSMRSSQDTPTPPSIKPQVLPPAPVAIVPIPILWAPSSGAWNTAYALPVWSVNSWSINQLALPQAPPPGAEPWMHENYIPATLAPWRSIF